MASLQVKQLMGRQLSQMRAFKEDIEEAEKLGIEIEHVEILKKYATDDIEKYSAAIAMYDDMELKNAKSNKDKSPDKKPEEKPKVAKEFHFDF